MPCHEIRKLLIVVWLGVVTMAFCRGQDVNDIPPKEITNSVGMKLVLIPAGRFTMGSPADEPHSRPNETLHKVEISKPFYMGSLEVTEQQFAQVMGIEPRVVQQKNSNGRVIGNKVIPFTSVPVSTVTWFDANEFCEKLSNVPEEKKERREYRLPTEAEWEYACRAGTQSAYSFGDSPSELGNYGWYRGNAGTNKNERIKLGGQKRPNAWGLYDMHGNAHEWCLDLYANYREGFALDPAVRARAGAMIMSKVISRGGGSNSPAEFCRSANRNSPYADDPGGFRVVMRISATQEVKE
jgi:formylglycine-generating enzyme required for sulfatase activity